MSIDFKFHRFVRRGHGFLQKLEFIYCIVALHMFSVCVVDPGVINWSFGGDHAMNFNSIGDVF